MADQPIADDILKLSFEEALEELKTIVHRLEEGGDTLEAALETFKRGSDLRRHCENKLRDAQGRIDKIMEGTDGSLETEPLDSP